MISRVLEVHEGLKTVMPKLQNLKSTILFIQVCREKKLAELTGGDIDYLIALQKLLKPFYEYLVAAQTDTASLAHVYKRIKDLLRHAKEFEVQNSAFILLIGLVFSNHIQNCVK